MGGFKEYGSHDAVGLAELVARGDVSPEELLEEALARAAALNPKLNAIVIDLEDAARKQLANGLDDGPFRGVPWLLKDIGTNFNGYKTTSGCRFFQDYVADHDSALVERHRKAGLVTFGKSASPEFGLTTSTESVLYGETHNPWSLPHTPGGSSGGSASAVSAGIVPAADASDGGGSIRIPASCCGLVGLKPSRGRVSPAPDRGEGWSGMSISGVLSRTVRDTAALLDQISGYEPGDPYAAPTPDGSFASQVERDPGKLRIAFHTEAHNEADTHPDCRKAVEEAAKVLEGLGHHVEEKALKYDPKKFGKAFRIIATSSLKYTLESRGEVLGREVTESDVEHLTWLMYKSADRYSGSDYMGAVQVVHDIGRAAADFFQHYDVILTPTMPGPPQLLGGKLRMNHPVGREFSDALALTVGYTQFHNGSGCPAVSLPLSLNEEGLPIGLQFAAAYGREDTLLRLAAQLEKAMPWADKRPEMAL